MASVPYCSTITSGAWFGNITPPAPNLIMDVSERGQSTPQAMKMQPSEDCDVLLPGAGISALLSELGHLDTRGEAISD